jgi:uncharacterized damage-inducible protein DinB
VTLQDLRALVDYHYWARDGMLDALEPLTAEQFTRDMGSSFRSVRDTAAHSYSAEWVWYSRWQGTSPAAMLPFDQFPDVSSLRAAWLAQERKTRASLDGLDENSVARIIEYRTFNGEAASSRFWQMLQHLVNHASYHRGQVTTMLRQMGANPPRPTDLIAFYRTRA